MKKRHIILCTLMLSTSLYDLNAQTCSGGEAAEEIVIDITGANSAGSLGSPGNTSGTECFDSGVAMDVVGAAFTDVDVNPAGDSWCSEAILDLGNSLNITFAVGEGNAGPCDNAYDSGGLIDLTNLGLVFGTDASGCVTWETFESFDDDNGSTADQTFGSGTITIWGCPPSEVLPVDLVSFDGKAKESANAFKWETASEINTQFMILERSENDFEWEEITRHDAKGNSSSGAIYFSEDRDPLVKAFYRLRMVDFDGFEEFSNVINIEREAVDFNIRMLGANPVEKELSILVTSSTESQLHITLISMLGEVVLSQQYPINSGISNISTDVQDIPSGMYELLLESGIEKKAQLIIKG